MFKSNKGFTLIELLVVITIIGILATWAVTIYTSQIQKARDTTRINDSKALQAAIEQVYQDNTEYPHSDEFASWWIVNVKTFMERIPSDPKTGQLCNWTTPCDYIYLSNADNNTIAHGEYEISTAFENDWNVRSKAAWDSWSDPIRLESWIDITTNDSSYGAIITSSWCLQIDWTAADGSENQPIKIAATCL